MSEHLSKPQFSTVQVFLSYLIAQSVFDGEYLAALVFYLICIWLQSFLERRAKRLAGEQS